MPSINSSLFSSFTFPFLPPTSTPRHNLLALPVHVGQSCSPTGGETSAVTWPTRLSPAGHAERTSHRLHSSRAGKGACLLARQVFSVAGLVGPGGSGVQSSHVHLPHLILSFRASLLYLCPDIRDLPELRIQSFLQVLPFLK